MEKKFEIAKFETLESSNEMLKGGFSTAYVGGAGAKLEVNFAKGCGCTIITNGVAGCACSPAPTPVS
ncbi:MAG: hypothetical protein LBP85_01435 [Prevotellaceae bacterium]|jgi:hypothetical protein|nr:hypothetical protein [Prevotellaceae bacterium]